MGEFKDVESRLRSERPRLDSHVDDAIRDRIGARRSRRGRAGLALVRSTGIMAALTAVGGVG